MSLKTIIEAKDRQFQSMLNKFDKEFTSLTVDAQKQIMSLFRRGDFTMESMSAITQEYDGLIQEWTIRNQEAIKYTKQMADEMGVKFAITKETVKNFDLIQDINTEALSNNMKSFITDMRKFGMSARLEGKNIGEITIGLEDKFAALGRRLNTEAYTGIRQADAIVKKDFFENAGIELYVYDGPGDNKTRDDCLNTLQDPRQSTGWTIEEINSSNTPFIERGGYNCRHEWMPFV